MESDHLDLMGRGRMYDFCRWLHARAPDNLPTTHAGYVSTIRSHYFALVGWEFRHSPLLTRYFAKSEQIPRERAFRDPATRDLILAVARDLSIPAAVRAAIILAWNGLLRVSEYVADADWALPHLKQFNLLREDAQPYSSAGFEGYRVRIKRSKSDKYNAGQWQYYMRRPGDDLCPVAALECYLVEQRSLLMEGRPLFVRRNETGRVIPITRADVNAALKAHAVAVGADPRYISSHSLRVGGAFHMASQGAALELIQQRGRWSARGSNEIALMYTRVDSARLLRVSDALRPIGVPHSLLGRR